MILDIDRYLFGYNPKCLVNFPAGMISFNHVLELVILQGRKTLGGFFFLSLNHISHDLGRKQTKGNPSSGMNAATAKI